MRKRMNEFGQSETISIRRDAILDLRRVRDEFDAIVESIELMADEEFMESHKKAKGQIRRMLFDEWVKLYDSTECARLL
jgi:hypothetical protein